MESQFQEPREVELLVHNLSHSDLVLDVSHARGSQRIVSVARPKFSHFKNITQKIVRRLEHEPLKAQAPSAVKVFASSSAPTVAYFPLVSRNKVDVPLSDHKQIPTGYVFADGPICVEDESHLRFRQASSDLTNHPPDAAGSGAPSSVALQHSSTESSVGDECVIKAAYFPLVAALLPKWLQSIEEYRGGSHTQLARKYSTGSDIDYGDSSRSKCQKVILLVSGRGTPMDQNASMRDNSTKYTARMIKFFIEQTYPEITVKLLDSATNLFRYDENIVFVKHELLPAINYYRDKLVSSVGGRWKEHMRLSLSFADGSSARISAINASLRYYRPSYMHFWQLKSFWREKKVREDDIEYHSYEEIATEPAIDLHNAALDPLIQAVVKEMTCFRSDFSRVLQDRGGSQNGDGKGGGGGHDLAAFWLRKTRKPVLAVLLVQKGEDGPLKLYRGTNMEVSMPTGSLCAERNVIGSALADDITLKRQDLKVIAVYSAFMPAEKHNANATSAVIGGSSSGAVSGPKAFSPARQSSNMSQEAFCLPISDSSVGAGSTGSTGRAAAPASFGPSIRRRLTRTSSNDSRRSTDDHMFSPSATATAAGGCTSPWGNGYDSSDSDRSAIDLEDPNGIKAAAATVPVADTLSRSPDVGQKRKAINPSHVQWSSSASGSTAAAAPITEGSATAAAKSKVSEGDVSGDRKPIFKNTRSFSTSSASGNIGRGGSERGGGGGAGRKRSKAVAFSSPQLQPAHPSEGHGSESAVAEADSPTKGSETADDSIATVGLTGSVIQISNQQHRQHQQQKDEDESAATPTPTATVTATATVAGSGSGAKPTGGSSTPTRKQRAFNIDYVGSPSPAGASHGYVQSSSAVSLLRATIPSTVPKTTIITVDENDLNPLKPCGACNEWLKKIAEVNPQLRVVTFTDADCNGIYIEHVDH